MWLMMILPGELFGPVVFGWWWYPAVGLEEFLGQVGELDYQISNQLQ